MATPEIRNNPPFNPNPADGGDFGDTLNATTALVTAKPYPWIEPTKIPPRRWLYGLKYLRQMTSMVIAPGGIGKFAVGQPGEEGGGIDGLAAFAHLDDSAENDLMGGMEEILFPQAFFPR